MIKIKKPQDTQKDILENCIYNIKKGSRRDRIISSKKAIEKSVEYDNFAEKGELFSFEIHNKVDGGATKDDMVWLYDKKFVGDGGRKYYDKIMSIPPYGTCPFCGQRKVSTLDHFLPKTLYPTYAINPFNLVAACSDCNKLKRNEGINSLENQLIHPYYDDFNDDIWIKANINESDPIGFDFYTIKPDRWDIKKYKRANNHFNKFQLNKLYKAHAAEMFSEYSVSLKKLYYAGKVNLVKEDLYDRIEEARANRLNGWKVAMYDALLNNEWFFTVYLPKKYYEKNLDKNRVLCMH